MAWRSNQSSPGSTQPCVPPLRGGAALHGGLVAHHPLMAPLDWLAAAATAALAYQLAEKIAAVPARRSAAGVLLGTALGAVLGTLPPMHPGLWTRLAIALASASTFALFYVLLHREVRDRASPMAWAQAVLVARGGHPALAVLAAADRQLPARRSPHAFCSPSIATCTRGHLGWLHGNVPFNQDDLRLVKEGCRPGSRIVGTLDQLFVRDDSDAPWRAIDYAPGDHHGAGLRARTLYSPEWLIGELWEIDLQNGEDRQTLCELRARKGHGGALR